MSRIVTVDYSVPLTVRVDLDEKRVIEVWLHLESFQSVPRGRFTRVEEDGRVTEIYLRDVFFGYGDWPDNIEGRELCDGEHPLADEAFAIADGVDILHPERQLDLWVIPE